MCGGPCAASWTILAGRASPAWDDAVLAGFCRSAFRTPVPPLHANPFGPERDLSIRTLAWQC